ncbi:MAG: glycosyltransferase, partial [bacterium]
LICGAGNYEEMIVQRAEELNLVDQVKMCGYINNKEIHKYYTKQTEKFQHNIQQRMKISGYV